MELSTLAEQLDLTVLRPNGAEASEASNGAEASLGREDRQVTGGYASDLLSDVLANAKAGFTWVTNQKHVNVIAVASLLGLAGVVMAGGVTPDDNAVEKAEQEDVVLFTTSLSAFEVVGRLYELGVRSHDG